MTNWRFGKSSQVYQANKPGVHIVSSSSANTKGSWTEVIATTNFISNYLWFTGAWTTGGRQYLVDIAIGSTGNEKTILSNLHITGSTSNTSRCGYCYAFPIYIPSGEKISVRCQSNGTSQGFWASIGLSTMSFLTLPGFNKVITYGANTGDSGGTSVDPGGTSGTKGSWVEFSAATEMNIAGILMGIGNAGNNVPGWGQGYIDIGIGASSSEKVVIPDLTHYMTYENQSRNPSQTPLIPCAIPKGSRLVVRADSEVVDATDRLIDVILYAVCY